SAGRSFPISPRLPLLIYSSLLDLIQSLCFTILYYFTAHIFTEAFVGSGLTGGYCHMHAIHPIHFPARPGAAGLRNNNLV
ncbi:uncharacterized protein C8R40DRAFT_1110660, partial [Lentinula edodes]|uniref:uncharacterized protein n=1 Tax=Lentinula edodes TaxID=5353 RepID=UPI001E8DC059